MHELISGLFLKHFGNSILEQQGDSAILPVTARIPPAGRVQELPVNRSHPAMGDQVRQRSPLQQIPS